VTTERSVVVGRDGRAKAYRPLPAGTRAAAVSAGLAAYDRGDFFEAHEELEPAWMGTDDPAARALLQGLIKVAAAYVHDVRGNPAGTVRNLEGARLLLDQAREGGPSDEVPGLDVVGLIEAIDARLADLAVHPEGPSLGPPELIRNRKGPDPTVHSDPAVTATRRSAP
jgi:predicted metal-dependent hydrolase